MIYKAAASIPNNVAVFLKKVSIWLRFLSEHEDIYWLKFKLVGSDPVFAFIFGQPVELSW